MYSNRCFYFKCTVLFSCLYMTSVVTSAVINNNTTNTSVEKLNTNIENASTSSNTSSSSVKVTQHNKNSYDTPMMASEGGFIKSSEFGESIESKHDKSVNTKISQNHMGFDKEMLTERNANPSITARKGVQSKISPRKGVESPPNLVNETLESQRKVDFTPAVLKNKSTAVQAGSKNNSPVIATTVIPIAPTTGVNNSSKSSVNKIPSGNTTLATVPPIKKHKPKPTVTIGEAEIDKPIPALPTKTPPLGMPRKIDYIVPIMITIVTIPLLIALSCILYRRGRDCWEKRHYRRMDFLIDGMYND